jgi:hypothetical protein
MRPQNPYFVGKQYGGVLTLQDDGCFPKEIIMNSIVTVSGALFVGTLCLF